MTQILKQSTAATIKLGPFVDATDGATAEDALTIQKADVRLSANGGNMAAASADQGTSDAGAPHDELGYYDVSLDATDTATVGRLQVMVSESGARPVKETFQVVEEAIFDAFYAASATGLATPALKKLTRFDDVTWIDTTDSAKTVIEAASAGALCILGPGTHALAGNGIAVPAGVTVRGCGRDVTTITSTLTAAAIITPGDNSLLEDFTIHSLNSTQGVLDFPLGATGTSQFSDAICRRLRVIGFTDAIYFDSSNACDGLFEDVILQTGWDAFVVGGAAHDVILRNSLIDIYENSNGNTATGIILNTADVKVRAERVKVFMHVGTGTDTLAGATCSAGTLELMDSTISLLGTAASNNYSLLQLISGVIQVTNCEFDRDKTSGTIIDPTAGFTPDDRANLNDIETNVGTAGAGLTDIPWNADWDTEVQSEVQDAIEANGLDHWIAVAESGSPVANNSLLAKLVSSSATAAWGDFANTTDSLQAQRDNVGTAGANLTIAGIAGTLNTFDELVDGAEDLGDALDSHGYTTARAANLDNMTTSVGGTGADEVTLNWTNSTTGLAVADGDAWVTSDSAGATVVAGTLQTDSNGDVTFMLDDGNVYFAWFQKDGVEPIRGEQFTAVADV